MRGVLLRLTRRRTMAIAVGLLLVMPAAWIEFGRSDVAWWIEGLSFLAGATGLAIFCPITSQVRGYPFEVAVPPGLKVAGAILSDQVKSLDWRARRAALLCRLPRRTTREVLAKLAVLLSDEE